MFELRYCCVLAAGMCSSLLAGVAVGETSVATAPVAAAVEILPPDEPWAGATRGEWDARWWQWAVSMPEEVNPNFDTSGERCGYGQSGPVFFLPGNVVGEEPAEITCVVAAGTAIYVQRGGHRVLDGRASRRSSGELRTSCGHAPPQRWIEATDFQARVNGQDVADLDAYRTESPLFTLTFAEDNIFGVQPGVAQSVSAAYSLIIAPPPPGRIRDRHVGDVRRHHGHRDRRSTPSDRPGGDRFGVGADRPGRRLRLRRRQRVLVLGAPGRSGQGRAVPRRWRRLLRRRSRARSPTPSRRPTTGTSRPSTIRARRGIFDASAAGEPVRRLHVRLRALLHRRRPPRRRHHRVLTAAHRAAQGLGQRYGGTDLPRRALPRRRPGRRRRRERRGDRRPRLRRPRVGSPARVRRSPCSPTARAPTNKPPTSTRR